jgi:hypothetical protein
MAARNPIGERQGVLIYDDLREATRDLDRRASERYYRRPAPALDPRHDRAALAAGARVNLFRRTCEKCDGDRPPRREDLGAFCRHLAVAALRRAELGELDRLLLETLVKQGEEKLLARDLDGAEIYFGFQNANRLEWINVYAPFPERPDGWRRSAYSLRERRWAFGGGPDRRDRVEALLLRTFAALLRAEKRE